MTITTALQKMDAEILFHNPDDVNAGIAELTRQDFDVEILDLVDEYGPTIWIRARTITELDADQFFRWVNNLAESINGWLYEAGHSDMPERTNH
jgi:hypothetical protein